MPADVSIEEELMLLLARVAARRAADSARIRELAAQADRSTLLDLFARQRLVALLGSRLLESAGDVVDPALRRDVEAANVAARHRHTLNAHLARDFARRLDAAGIAAVPLKGPLLAERLHPDPALRSSPSDLDFLVRPDQLDAAVREFARLGYTVHDDTVWADGLPHYHYGLSPTRPGLPKVELHWRIHWYEKEFGPRLIDRCGRDPDGVRMPRPADDLACLLIIFARDGFVGLRLAADIGAWWDAHETGLDGAILDPVLEENPRLRPTLLAAVEAAHNLIGIPRERLISEHWKLSRRARLAPLLVDWRDQSTLTDLMTNITLIDLLLTPIGASRTFVRHYYLQPLDNYIRTYGWKREARLRNEVLRSAHALARVAKSVWRYSRRLWSIRRQAAFDDLPGESTRQGSDAVGVCLPPAHPTSAG